MKKLPLLMLLSLALPQAADAQLVTNFWFGQITPMTCPYDSTQTVNWPQGWSVYQTTDGRWDGPIDSSRCISFSTESAGRVALDQIEASQPLFISTQFFSDEGRLLPDWVYGVSFAFTSPSPLLAGTDCPDEICSGLIYRIEVPAETPGARNFRTYTVPDANNPFAFHDACLVTERFEDQYLERLVFKFTFDSQSPLTGELRLSFVSISPPEIETPIAFEELVLPESSFDGQAYTARIETLVPSIPWPATFIGRYPDTTYPSEANIRYVEARIASEPATQQTINVIVDEYFGPLHFQPFTRIRAGLVAGSDSLRHILNIVSADVDWCFGTLVDLVFDGSTHFIYDGGQLTFNGPQSCLMFLNGSELRVADGRSLHYGHNGLGILGLGRGSHAVLGRNSKLYLNNLLLLWNFDTGPDNQAYIDLQPGNELVFGPQARLERLGFQEQGAFLNVYMNGGRLDDSALSPAERRLIRRIYPEPAPDMAADFHIFPNPVGEQLQWSYLAPEAGELHWAWHNALGQVLQQGTLPADRGKNVFALPCTLAPGGYFMVLRTSRGRAVRAFIK
jgi:hypothetical protein